MQKRKVLFVIHQLNFGGVQKLLISQLNAIDYDNNDVTLYIRKNRLDLLPLVNKNVSNIIINDDSTHYYRMPYSILMLILIKLFNILNMDISSINNSLKNYILNKKMMYEKKHFFSNVKYDISISCKQGNTAKFVSDNVNSTKKIMFFHSSTDDEHELHQRIMANYDSIIGGASSTVDNLKEWYPEYISKMDYIENYVDINDIEEKSKAFRVDVPNDKLILCSCGRFTTVKGFDIAVDAAKELKDKGVDFVWYFVGDGVERADIEKRIKTYHLNDNIIITGMQDNPYPYLRCCDIYIQPSREEAYGLTIKEALILKKPIVTTDTVGGNTLVKENVNGKIVDINGKSIANSLCDLISNNSLRVSILDNVKKTDFSHEVVEYKNKWKNLLEE